MKSPHDPKLSLTDKFLHLIESVAASDRLILRMLLFTIIISGLWVAHSFNNQHLESTPTHGGSFTEGILGTPRYINPVLATTRADQDIVALVYSGLMEISPDGTLRNDIAESITVSEDGLTYNVILRKDITFHDETPLTATDVAYTIRLIQDPDLKSPLRGNWTDVMVEEISEYELNIIIEEAYAPFIENFTVGIIPAHTWSTLPIEQLPFSQLNTRPIGSGPFIVTDTKHDASGLINHYRLSAFREHNTNPKIADIELNFYQNEDSLIKALLDKEIDATAYVPPSRINEIEDDNYQLIEESLPRTFGIFFNQSRSAVTRDPAVREALSIALDRDMLIEKAFSGHGVPITSPITFSNIELESEKGIEDTATTSPSEQAKEILTDADWLQNNLGLWEKQIDEETVTLSLTLRTSNAPLFESLSDLIAEQWSTIGVEIATEQFEQTGLVQSVIRPRDFEALLFGHDMSRSYDLYPIWHSSQQDDPGLNVSQYANVSVDSLLEDARLTQSTEERVKILSEAAEIITKERPAIFIAQPTLTYIVNKNINTVEMQNIGRPADRFSNISEWHTESDSLWPMFRNDI